MQTKWWGWGAPDKTYALEERPNAWPFLQARLGLTEEVQRPPIEESAIQLPPSRLPAEVFEAIAQAVGELDVTAQARDRLVHAYGKSYRDLVRIRRGQIENPPDAVVYATTEAQVEALIALAKVHGFAIIPYGGGTSVVGGLEMPENQRERTFVSLDLTRMEQLLSLDPVSQLAVVQPGILGPKLEELLQAQGFTLGHYPQSFEFSTLGGWVATRSAGQQSTRYGRIEEIVQAVRVVTPQGVMETRPLPAAAQGPDLNQIAIGSEGIYGVITQVTVRVRPKPERRDYRAFLFKDWASGQTAIRTIM
ncbi:MAG TPA: FAD-binding oxidoreductase, partial [Oscillatoriaceae cyanobacterium]